MYLFGGWNATATWIEVWNEFKLTDHSLLRKEFNHNSPTWYNIYHTVCQSFSALVKISCARAPAHTLYKIALALITDERSLIFCPLQNKKKLETLIENLHQNNALPLESSMAEMAVQGLLEFWPCNSVNNPNFGLPIVNVCISVMQSLMYFL